MALQGRGCVALHEWGVRGTAGVGACVALQGWVCVALQERSCVALQDLGLCGAAGEGLRGTAGVGMRGTAGVGLCGTLGEGLCGTAGLRVVWRCRSGTVRHCRSGAVCHSTKRLHEDTVNMFPSTFITSFRTGRYPPSTIGVVSWKRTAIDGMCQYVRRCGQQEQSQIA